MERQTEREREGERDRLKGREKANLTQYSFSNVLLMSGGMLAVDPFPSLLWESAPYEHRIPPRGTERPIEVN